eukprot:scaffold37_cov172-Ochromonas_danica.AAC.3
MGNLSSTAYYAEESGRRRCSFNTICKSLQKQIFQRLEARTSLINLIISVNKAVIGNLFWSTLGKNTAPWPKYHALIPVEYT